MDKTGLENKQVDSITQALHVFENINTDINHPFLVLKGNWSTKRSALRRL